MYKQQTLIASLNFTNIINFFLKSDWLITMLFQGQQRCWCRTWWNQVLRLVLAYIEGVMRLMADRCGDWWVRIGGTQRVCFYMKFVCAGEMSWWTGVYIYIICFVFLFVFTQTHMHIYVLQKQLRYERYLSCNFSFLWEPDYFWHIYSDASEV